MKRKPSTEGLKGDQILRVAKIESFFPQAEENANNRLKKHLDAGGSAYERRKCYGNVTNGSVLTDTYNHCVWSGFFHEEMNSLTRAAGLRTI